VFANAIKHDFKSKNPTTRWSDIIRLKWGVGFTQKRVMTCVWALRR
jgi:hypothetical protein